MKQRIVEMTTVEDKIYKMLEKSVMGEIDTSVIDEFLDTNIELQKICGDGSHNWAFELYKIKGTNLYALEEWADGSGINCYKIYNGIDEAREEFKKERENLNSNFDWNLPEFDCG